MPAALQPVFPALGAADIEVDPIILIDTREQQPLKFVHLASRPATLQTADYSILGAQELFGIERKTVADLVACCTGDNRSRFERELHRLRGYRFKRLLIVGREEDVWANRYTSNIKPKAVMGSLTAFEVRYDIPAVFCATPEAAATQIERWAHYFCRELVQSVNELRRGPE